VVVMLDGFSRRIVGWSMAEHPRTDMVLDALDMASGTADPTLGWSTILIRAAATSLAFGRRCREAGITPSMCTVGDALDNAVAESFFATSDCELLDRTTGQPAKPSGVPCSTSSRSSTTAGVATPPSTTAHPSTTTSSTDHQHPPHS
jgi:transposase InsO family protein